jgi:hypothetical protein
MPLILSIPIASMMDVWTIDISLIPYLSSIEGLSFINQSKPFNGEGKN